MAKYISYKLLVELCGKESNIVIDEGFAKLNYDKFNWSLAANTLLQGRDLVDYDAESSANWEAFLAEEASQRADHYARRVSLLVDYSDKWASLKSDFRDERASMLKDRKLKEALTFAKYFNQ